MFGIMEKSSYIIVPVPGWSLTGHGKYPIPKDSVQIKGGKPKLLMKGKYLDMPITNISYEQAQDFCDWRTKVNEVMANEQGIPSFKFQLPSFEDFNSYNEVREEKMNIKNKIILSGNYFTDYGDGYLHNHFRNYHFYVPCASYPSNNLGLFDVQGNVSEMTGIKGVAMGGNYKLPYTESLQNKIQNYTLPQPWLGFRCVATMK
jgi:formylglycine-generating enzyme required for sulfatase activity